MSIYFQDDFVTLHHANSFDVMADMHDESVDCVITDPPYTEFVHKNASSNRGGNGANAHINFEHFTDELLDKAFVEFGRLTKGWVVSTLDHRHALPMEHNPPKGLELKRIGVWVKNNPMPQLTADRPAHGFTLCPRFGLCATCFTSSTNVGSKPTSSRPTFQSTLPSCWTEIVAGLSVAQVQNLHTATPPAHLRFSNFSNGAMKLESTPHLFTCSQWITW